MTRLTLERRVKSLELQVVQLKDELRSAQGGMTKDWRRTIGAFTDDKDLKKLLHEAMRFREVDRKNARSKSAPKRGRKQ